MLSIKLPRVKVARALLDCADAYAASIKAELTAWHKDLEVWRGDVYTRTHGGPQSMPPRPPKSVKKDKAMRFAEMSTACTHSTGDVYVDAELWKEIKGYYY